jgi:hypothetical protein
MSPRDDVADRAMTLIEEVAAAAKDAVTEYGPEAWEVALWVVRVDAIGEIIVGLFLALLIVVIWCAVVRDNLKALNAGNNKKFEWRIKMVACGGFGIAVCGAAFAVKMLNVWVYVAIFAPELWLAKKAISAVLGP